MELLNRLQITQYEFTDEPCAAMFLNLYNFYQKGIISRCFWHLDCLLYLFSYRAKFCDLRTWRELKCCCFFTCCGSDMVGTHSSTHKSMTQRMTYNGLKNLQKSFQKKSCIIWRIHDFELFTVVFHLPKVQFSWGFLFFYNTNLGHLYRWKFILYS